jgi:hypothetical protein
MKIFLKQISFLFLIWGLIHTPLFSENVSLFLASETLVKNAKWSNPSNGEIPKILSFDVAFKIDASHLISAVIDKETITKNNIIDPLQLVADGDVIEILKEGFILNQDKHSWFQVKNRSNEAVFDGQGPSIKEKAAPPNDPTLVQAKDVRIEEKGERLHEVSFSLDGSYVLVSVDTARYHNFYTDKPYILLNKRIEDISCYGDYTITFVVQDVETGEVMEFTSMLYNNSSLVSFNRADPVDIKITPHYGFKAVDSFRMELILGNKNVYKNLALFHPKNLHLQGSYKPIYEYVANWVAHQGQEFMILKEVPDQNNRRCSYFQWSSLKTGGVIDLYGPARHGSMDKFLF